MKKSAPFIIIVAVLVAGVGMFLVFSKKRSGNDSVSAFVDATPQNSSNVNSPAAAQASPASTIPITKPNVKVSSPVVLEEYGDYQCPPCGALYPILKQIEAEYGNQLKIVFHHFPLAKIHKNAMTAAPAPETAPHPKKLLEMPHTLFPKQNEWEKSHAPP